ncbi:glycosyltransferase [Aurantiacibacter luteus]|uniref:Glycosyltransferase subfamily 4-like N-terminal domain-containing protein n=1 Tax=Aurantiacibacter luteus TaxID=1581420 RepID=A0A0G9N2D2_9SPHN|nr:glycosyltransferase [Aurantiacibacter luteus]KLE35683.1 hypothetical protein AAW00_04610 [Aurantiacibacter luteus]
MDRTCIIVSPYFPPSALAGVHRARHLANNLPGAGWTPIVVSVNERFYEEPADFELAKLVDPSVELVRVDALDQAYARPFGLGDIGLRGYRSIRRAMTDLMRSRRIDAVLITGAPFYPMLLSGWIKRTFSVPVVLDFQDPWHSDWGETLPFLSKGGVSHALSKLMEPRAITGASHVTTVSQEQARKLVARYDALGPQDVTAIPIGSDPADFEALRRGAAPITSAIDESRWNLTYPGTIWPMVLPTLKAFLQGLAAWRERYPDAAANVKVNFIGTTAQPNNPSEYRVMPLAERAGIADLINEIPQRLPYVDALYALSRSDAGLMLGSEEAHYTASKLSLFLMSQRPYLSLFHERSDAHRSLVKAGGGIALGFTKADDLLSRQDELVEALERLRSQGDTIPRARLESYAEYTGANVARQYADVFEKLMAQR